MKLVELSNVQKVFNRGDETIYALKDVSVEINKGEFTSLVGTSGCGKSTLLHIIGLLDVATSGTYILDGKDVSSTTDYERTRIRSQMLGFIFQSFFLLPRLSALDNVIMPLNYLTTKISKKEKIERAQFMLSQVGLQDRKLNLPNQLSGGQRQRVAIARALINNPTLILADEPTGNLDSKTSKGILDLFVELHEKNKATIIIVTHDEEVAKLTKRQIRLSDGSIVNA